jgi:hypothetical protein
MEVEMHSTNDITYHMEIFVDGMTIPTENLEGLRNEGIEKAEKKIGEHLRISNWQNL